MIFGNLTDPVDWPGHEAEIPAAENDIVRAARGWLEVAHDREAIYGYFDHWLFEEFSYERPFVSNIQWEDDDGNPRFRVLRFDRGVTVEDVEHF